LSDATKSQDHNGIFHLRELENQAEMKLMKHREYLLVLLEAVTIDKQSARRYSSTLINHNAGTEASMLAPFMLKSRERAIAKVLTNNGMLQNFSMSQPGRTDEGPLWFCG